MAPALSPAASMPPRGRRLRPLRLAVVGSFLARLPRPPTAPASVGRPLSRPRFRLAGARRRASRSPSMAIVSAGHPWPGGESNGGLHAAGCSVSNARRCTHKAERGRRKVIRVLRPTPPRMRNFARRGYDDRLLHARYSYGRVLRYVTTTPNQNHIAPRVIRQRHNLIT